MSQLYRTPNGNFYQAQKNRRSAERPYAGSHPNWQHKIRRIIPVMSHGTSFYKGTFRS